MHHRAPAALVVVVAVAAACAACARGAEPPAGGTWLHVASLASPAAAGSAQPQLATAPDGAVIASWLEQQDDGHRFRLARLRREAAAWDSPVTIHEGSEYFANWADVPSVAAAGNGLLAAHWLQKSGPATYAYDVRIRTSTDGGRTWSEPFSPHRDGTQTEHGFASFFPWGADGLAIAWLDGRKFAEARAEHPGEGEYPMSGEMTLRAAPVAHGAAGDEMSIDERVCDCCPTSAVRTTRGIALAYRNRSAEEIRDIHVARFEDGRWTDGVPVARDGWQIAGCPVNGPSISAIGDRVALAWFSAPDAARVSVAFSNDGGASFGAPVRLDDGQPLGRVDAELLPDGSAIVGWIEKLDARAEFRARRVFPDGRRSEPVAIAALAASRASGYPRIARSGGRLVFAWVGDGGVEMAEGRVP